MQLQSLQATQPSAQPNIANSAQGSQLYAAGKLHKQSTLSNGMPAQGASFKGQMPFQVHGVGQSMFAPQQISNMANSQGHGQHSGVHGLGHSPTKVNSRIGSGIAGTAILKQNSTLLSSAQGQSAQQQHSNHVSQQHQFNGFSGSFIEQSQPAGIAGINLVGMQNGGIHPGGSNESNPNGSVNYAFYQSANGINHENLEAGTGLNRQLLNNRSSNMQQIGFIGISGMQSQTNSETNQIQQYQQLEQKLLQKHQEKQSESHGHRHKDAVYDSFSSQVPGQANVITGLNGGLGRQNPNNIGTNYQLPNHLNIDSTLGSNVTAVTSGTNASSITAITANSTSMLFQTPQVRPGSKKMSGISQGLTQKSQNNQNMFQGGAIINSENTQFQQLQHLQQMQEFHSQKKQHRGQNSAMKSSQLKGGIQMMAGTLSSKNLQTFQKGQPEPQYRKENKRFHNYNKSGQSGTRQHTQDGLEQASTVNASQGSQQVNPNITNSYFKKNSIQQSANLTALQQIENNMSIMNFQQQIIDSYAQAESQQQSRGDNSHQGSLQGSAQQQFQDGRNKDSRNSKRSVVFSKSKQNTTAGHQSTGETPSTPSRTNGVQKGHHQQRGLTQDSQLLHSQQFQNGQNSGSQIVSNQHNLTSNSKMKVNLNLQTVKQNKQNPKNMVFQKQAGPGMQQYQQMAELQATMQSMDESQQAQFIQQQQQIYQAGNPKAFINSKRRSGVADMQIRDNSIGAASQLGSKGIGSQSAMKQHSRVAKKMTTNNLNGGVPDGNQLIAQQTAQTTMFNKTMSNMASGINGQGFQGLVQANNSGQNVNGSVQFLKPLQDAPSSNMNLQNSLVVVRLNSIKPPADGSQQAQKSGNAVPQNQFQIQSIQSLTPEQQQQLIQQQQMIIQQQQQNQHIQQIMINKQMQLQSNLSNTQTADPAQQTSQSMSIQPAVMLPHQASQSLAHPVLQQQQSQIAKNHDNQAQQSAQKQKNKLNRPQSQNHRIVQGVTNSTTFNNNVSQHSGSNEGTITVPSRKLDQNASQSLDPNLKHQAMAQIQAGQAIMMAPQNLGQNQINGQLMNENQQRIALQNHQMNINNMNQNNQQPGSQSPAQKLISTKHLQIQQIRMVNNSSADNYANSDTDSQRQQSAQFNSGQSNLLKQNSGSPGNSKYFIKNQLRHISHLGDADDDEDHDAHEDHDMNLDGTHQGGHIGHIQNLREGGMTLEDDVESMLSEQFNTSNESMFRVRGVGGAGGPGGLQLGGAGGGGDSTFRCNDSMYDEDRGLISESEDGWNAEKDGADWKDNNIDDISEHSSDEMTDSEPEEVQEGGIVVKKVKKAKGEKGEKRKKKKKKVDPEAQGTDKANASAPGREQAQTIPAPSGETKKVVQTYKKLQEESKKGGKGEQGKVSKPQSNTKEVKKKDQAQQIKVNIQTKKNEKSTNNDMNMSKNNFNSPMIKGKGQEKVNQNNKQSNQNNTNKQNQNQKDQKKTLDDSKKEAEPPVPATPLKKAKKNGLKLQALNNALPKNLQECHERFFESNFKINPQFEYESAQLALKFLEQFDEPDGQYLAIAKKILDSFLKEYGSESEYLDAEGKKLDQEETHQAITDYLENLGVQEWISINFQKNQVAPTSVTHDPKTGKCKMNIKLPCEYREGRMMGVLDHEIGTHFLRKHNEKLQQWYKKREKFDMKTCIATEEGLACTNQMVQTVKDGKCKPFLYRSALNYYAAYMAKQLSFVDLFRDLEKYVNSPQSRWKFVLRVKRGLTDTSQKGGLYKDQVYLEGAVKILQRRKTLNFKALLCGKLSLTDYDREDIYSILNYEGQLLPPFMEDMEEYMRCLDEIAKTNHIDDDLVESQWGSEDEKQLQQELIDKGENNTVPANIADIIPSAAPSADQIAPKPEGENTQEGSNPANLEIQKDNTEQELKVSNGPSPTTIAANEEESPQPKIPENPSDQQPQVQGNQVEAGRQEEQLMQIDSSVQHQPSTQNNQQCL